MIAVHVTPRSGRDELLGLREDEAGRPVLHVRVKAAPEHGKANASVCAVVAKSLGVPKGAAAVLRGQSSRNKLIGVECSEKALEGWIEALPRI